MGEESHHPSVLVVWVPDTDERPSVQGVSGMEGSVKGPVGGGVEGDREGEKPVHDPGPPCRWEVQPGGIRLPLHHGCGRLVPAEEDVESEVSEWELRERREREEERRMEAEELGAGVERSLFLPTPSFMVSAGEG